MDSHPPSAPSHDPPSSELSAPADLAQEDCLSFDMLLTELSTFVNVPAEDFDETVEVWLKRLVEFLHVDRAALLEFDDRGSTLTWTHSFATPGLAPLPCVLINDHLPWMTEQLRKGKDVILSRIPDDLPDEAVAERALAGHVGAKSGLNLPIAVDGRTVCVIAFTSSQSYRQWGPDLLPRLRLVGSVLATAVVRRRKDQASRRSEERYRALVAASTEIVWRADAWGHIVFLSPAWQRLTGQSDADMSGQGWLVAVHPDDRERVRQGWEGATRTKQAYEAQLRVRAADGGYRDLHVRGNPIVDADGTVLEWVGTGTEAASGRLERQYHELITTLEAIVWRADARTLQFTYVSPQARTILGFPLEQWLSEPHFWERHLHPEDRNSVLARGHEAAQRLQKAVLEYRMVSADGRTVWLHNVVQVIDEEKQPKELIGVMVDITERKQTEVTLRVLSGRLIHAQEEERRRIARDLHDDISQRLALLGIGLQQLGETLDGSAGGQTQRVQDLHRYVTAVATDVHRLSHHLHPAKLRHLGLAAALSGLCREVAAQHDIQVQCVTEALPASTPHDVELCLFRITQEALRNVVKHSSGTVARVELAVRHESISLAISDNGNGFDPESLTRQHGLGLVSMQERVRLLHGILAIDSSPFHGTHISARLPLPAPPQAQPR